MCIRDRMRTGLEGLRYYLTPHMEGLTVSRFLQILLDAMSQLFFSLSEMCIRDSQWRG